MKDVGTKQGPGPSSGFFPPSFSYYNQRPSALPLFVRSVVPSLLLTSLLASRMHMHAPLSSLLLVAVAAVHAAAAAAAVHFRYRPRCAKRSGESEEWE